MVALVYKELSPFDYLAHHGIKGQRWGVRRFQNGDGTLTLAGKDRYLGDDKTAKRKKVATGIAVGITATAGAALTVYLVKKFGMKKLPDVSEHIDVGKDAVDSLLKETKIGSSPISSITKEIPKTYDFETLMRQNDDLLQKMYADMLK